MKQETKHLIINTYIPIISLFLLIAYMVWNR